MTHVQWHRTVRLTVPQVRASRDGDPQSASVVTEGEITAHPVGDGRMWVVNHTRLWWHSAREETEWSLTYVPTGAMMCACPNAHVASMAAAVVMRPEYVAWFEQNAERLLAAHRDGMKPGGTPPAGLFDALRAVGATIGKGFPRKHLKNTKGDPWTEA